MQKTASPVTAIGPVTKVIDLPEPGPLGAISIEIRKVHPAELLAKIGTLPSFEAGEKSYGLDAVVSVMAKSKAPIAAVAEAVIVAPPFAFGDEREEGKAWWGNLSWLNQLAVFNEGMAFAGLNAEVKEGTDADAARRVVRFPRDTKGPKVRPRTRGTRKATG